MLLLAGTLQPQGSSRLASLRFSGPVRIRKVRIYPKGIPVFAQHPETVISQTEPETFSLSLYFSAQSAPSSQEPKPKATNLLVPTSLVYPGGLRDFTVNMGNEFVTRLVVIHGNFEHVTLAVYGELVDVSNEPPAYEPMLISPLEKRKMPAPFDLANALDPTVLAQQFLKLVPSPPSMSLVTRLILCLKPQDDAWETIQYSSMDECMELAPDISGISWLQTAADVLMLPVADDIDPQIIESFSHRICQSLVEKSNDHLYAFAGLLRRASAQPSLLLENVLSSLDLTDLFEPTLLDRHIVERLHDAAANPVIAKAFNTPSILKSIQIFKNTHSNNNAVHSAATALQERILGWDKFVKVISGYSTDVSGLPLWLKALMSDDMTCGIFLYSVINGELLGKISELAVREVDHILPLWANSILPSFSQFIAFLKVVIGISFCLVSLCWAEDVTDKTCSERLLASIRLWQEIEGYREVVNHGLLLRRILYRLENILRQPEATSSPLSLLHAERIFQCLCSHPESMTHAELANLIHIDEPIQLTSVSEREVLSMQEVTYISKYGLNQAIITVMTWSEQTPGFCESCTLQAALLIIVNTLENRNNGEWTILQTSWQEGFHGLIYQLIELLRHLLPLIKVKFSLAIPPSMHFESIVRVLSCINQLIKIITYLIPSSTMPDRYIRSLVHDSTNMFVLTDAIDAVYPKWSSVNQIARTLRPSCADILTAVCDTREDGTVGQLVLHTLFYTAMHPENDDPMSRLEQSFYLLDLVLPVTISEDRSKEQYWSRKVIPCILPKLLGFYQALTTDIRVQLIKRLAELDRNEIGFCVFFVEEELKSLLDAFKNWQAPRIQPGVLDIFRLQILNSLEVLTQILEQNPRELSSSFYLESGILGKLSQVFKEFSRSRCDSVALSSMALTCLSYKSMFSGQTLFDLAIILLRSRSNQPACFIKGAELIKAAKASVASEIHNVLNEFASTLHRINEGDLASEWNQDTTLPQSFVSIILWFLEQDLSEQLLVRGVTKTAFMSLMPRISHFLTDEISFLSDVETRFSFDEETHDPPVWSVAPEPVRICFKDLATFWAAPPKTPPTPKLSGESIFRMATTSPITALAGSSRISTLTKTYQRDEFRKLSARQNTSRRPSVHVDAFQTNLGGLMGATPTITASSAAISPILPGTSTPAGDVVQLLPPLKFE